MTHVDPKAPANHPAHPSQARRRDGADWSYLAMFFTARELEGQAQVPTELLEQRRAVVTDPAAHWLGDRTEGTELVAALVDETDYMHSWDAETLTWHPVGPTEDDDEGPALERGACVIEVNSAEEPSADAAAPAEPEAPPAEDTGSESDAPAPKPASAPRANRRGKKRAAPALDDALAALDGLNG